MEDSSLHWSQKQEAVSSYKSLAAYLKASQFLPIFVLKIIILFISIYFFCTSKSDRLFSKDFLARVARITGKPKKNSLIHLMSFALYLVEKMESWSGKISFKKIQFQDDDVHQLVQQLEQGRGATLICSHLGNAELLRALAELDRTGVSRRIPTISIVDFSVSPHFFRMIEEVNPESMHHIISARDIGPDTVIILKQHIEEGGLVVIAGDRTSATTINSFFNLPFLGDLAPFASGPFILSMILEAPCYSVFGLRNRTISLFPKYKMFVNRLDVPQRTSRKERKAVAQQIAHQFSSRLERLAMEYPYQWYNFYNFWAEPTL